MCGETEAAVMAPLSLRVTQQYDFRFCGCLAYFPLTFSRSVSRHILAQSQHPAAVPWGPHPILASHQLFHFSLKRTQTGAAPVWGSDPVSAPPGTGSSLTTLFSPVLRPCVFLYIAPSGQVPVGSVPVRRYS